MSTKAPLFALMFGLAGFSAEPANENWPQFRGPGGHGRGAETAKLPSEFGPGKAVLWKTEIPLGHGSPCIWGDRIFVTAFDKTANKLEVIAVHRNKGNIVWRQTIPTAEIETVHPTSSPATSTPVTDGERIYVYAGSYGLIAYGWDGKAAWQYPMGVANSPFGSGTSPVLAGDVVVVTRDFPPDPMLVAVRTKDGSLAWKQDLPKSTQRGPRTAHSTPVVWNGQIILNRPGEVAAYRPKDGARLWWLPTASGATASVTAGDGAIYLFAPALGSDTMTIAKLPPFDQVLQKYDRNQDAKLSAEEAPADDLYLMKRAGVPDTTPGAHFTVKLFFASFDGNRDGLIEPHEYDASISMWEMRAKTLPPTSGIVAVRPAGEGALPPTAVAWTEARGAPEVTTPLEYRGRVYAINSGGVITCLDSQTGRLIYRGRVNAPGTYFASPVAAGGLVFVASVEGVVTVLEGGEVLKVLANNDLGEPVYGTPAPVGDTLYVRSARHLWAFGKAR